MEMINNNWSEQNINVTGNSGSSRSTNPGLSISQMGPRNTLGRWVGPTDAWLLEALWTCVKLIPAFGLPQMLRYKFCLQAITGKHSYKLRSLDKNNTQGRVCRCPLKSQASRRSTWRDSAGSNQGLSL